SQAEDAIRDATVTGVQTCALPIFVLPDEAAFAVGLDPRGGAPEPVTTVTGTTTMRRLTGCNVTVEATYPITVDVLFGSGAMPVLGMDALLAAMETGFQAAHWHYH